MDWNQSINQSTKYKQFCGGQQIGRLFVCARWFWSHIKFFLPFWYIGPGQGRVHAETVAQRASQTSHGATESIVQIFVPSVWTQTPKAGQIQRGGCQKGRPQALFRQRADLSKVDERFDMGCRNQYWSE